MMMTKLVIATAALYWIGVFSLGVVTMPEPQGSTLPVPTDARWAYVCDGDAQDPDDHGACPMVMALAAEKTGAIGWLKHYQYAGIIGAVDDSAGGCGGSGQTATGFDGQYDALQAAVAPHYSYYGIPAGKMWDVEASEADAAVSGDPEDALVHVHLATQINRSTASDPLWIILAGPAESLVRAFEKAYELNSNSAATFEHVTILSHHNWNETWTELSSHRDLFDFYDMFESGGVWDAWSPPSYLRIGGTLSNGFNDTAYRSVTGSPPTNQSAWNWMKVANGGTDALEHIFDSMDAAGDLQAATVCKVTAYGDCSDAGMVHWFLGNGTSTPVKQTVTAGTLPKDDVTEWWQMNITMAQIKTAVGQ